MGSRPIAAENALMELMLLTEISDEQQGAYIAAHPTMLDPNVAQTALQVARLRTVAGDLNAARRYAGAAERIGALLGNDRLIAQAHQLGAEASGVSRFAR